VTDTDKDLLELAAKAAGVTKTYDDGGEFFVRPGCEFQEWNPMDDDGDAFRLAVKLRLQIDCMGRAVAVGYGKARQTLQREHEVGGYYDTTDELTATRRAIVRAAASIGKEMGK
jgi:hypothetical protein